MTDDQLGWLIALVVTVGPIALANLYRWFAWRRRLRQLALPDSEVVITVDVSQLAASLARVADAVRPIGVSLGSLNEPARRVSDHFAAFGANLADLKPDPDVLKHYRERFASLTDDEFRREREGDWRFE